MGLAYIAASLETHGHQVQILDAYALRLSWEDFLSQVQNLRPDVLGITAMTPTADTAAKTISAVRPWVPFLVLGGPHPTAVGANIFHEMPDLDAAVVGEGEDITPALLDWWNAGKPGAPPPGVLTQTHPFQTNRHSPDIHRIAKPARHLLPNTHYRYLFATRPGFTTMITSRGCPFQCSFCDKSVSGSRWRAREPDDVVEEMSQVVRDHQVGFINFYDDNFTLKRSRVEAICEEILRRNLQVDWKCEGRVDSVDVELLRLMRRAGCRCIAYGVESGHAPTLELLRKDIQLEQVHSAFQATQEAGLRSLAYMILGSPGETAQDVQRSVDFCRQIGADYVQFSTLTAMPGTPLFSQSHRTQAQGIAGPMDGDLSRNTLTDLSPEELSRLLRKAWTGFYLRPKPMARLVRDAWRSGSLHEAMFVGRAMGNWMISSRAIDGRSTQRAKI